MSPTSMNALRDALNLFVRGDGGLSPDAVAALHRNLWDQARRDHPLGWCWLGEAYEANLHWSVAVEGFEPPEDGQRWPTRAPAGHEALDDFSCAALRCYWEGVRLKDLGCAIRLAKLVRRTDLASV